MYVYFGFIYIFYFDIYISFRNHHLTGLSGWINNGLVEFEKITKQRGKNEVDKYFGSRIDRCGTSSCLCSIKDGADSEDQGQNCPQ
jgi:hypothetical protein